jgi:hypothetical protein
MVMQVKSVAILALVCAMASKSAAGGIAADAKRLVDGADYRGIGLWSTTQDMHRLISGTVLNALHPGHQQGIRTFEVRDIPTTTVFSCGSPTSD